MAFQLFMEMLCKLSLSYFSGQTPSVAFFRWKGNGGLILKRANLSKMSEMTNYLDSSFALDICVLSSGCLSPHEDSSGDFDPLRP